MESGLARQEHQPVSPRVISNKKRGNAIVGMMKWYDRIQGQEAHGHRKEKNVDLAER